MLHATRHRAHLIRFEDWRPHDDVDQNIVATRVAPHPSAPTCIGPGHDTPTRVVLDAGAPIEDSPTRVGSPPQAPDDSQTRIELTAQASSHDDSPTRIELTPQASSQDDSPTQIAPRPQPQARHNDAILELPVQLLVLEHMKLAPTPAHIAELSRSVALVSTRLEPEVGRRVVLRIAAGGKAGSAVGEVKTTVAGTGFTVRICASTAEFRAYADAVRSFLGGKLPIPPALDEPISAHLL